VLTQADRERLVGDILRVSFEALTLEEFGAEGVPLIERLFDTSNSLLYQCNERREMVKICGTMEEAHSHYADHYYSSDPMQALMKRLNLWILHGPRYPEWKMFLKLPVYTDHARHHEIDNYIHMRLNEADHHEPKMAGMLIARSSRQPDFSEGDGLILARLLPALEALTRRSDRVKAQLCTQSIVETVLELDPRPRIALDPQGRFLWASERSETLLKLRRGGRWVVPDALVQAARGLGALTGKDLASAVPVASVAIPREKAAPVRADLRLARTRTGSPFVLAELELPDVSPRMAEVAERFQLTGAEAEVLGLISAGLSDREIGRHLFVSMATVRTHVGRILGKLGVHSRVQAALLSHGLLSEPDFRNETSLPPLPRRRP
jgi:DNA-binding CsgD family transcriptional regulator